MKIPEIVAKPKRAEERVVEWLKKHRFKDVEKNHRPIGCWDITARKGKEKWLIEVKTGEHPKIDMANFQKMLEQKGFRIGLALVTEELDVHLLEYPKMRLVAFRAWKTRKNRERARAMRGPVDRTFTNLN